MEHTDFSLYFSTLSKSAEHAKHTENFRVMMV